MAASLTGQGTDGHGFSCMALPGTSPRMSYRSTARARQHARSERSERGWKHRRRNHDPYLFGDLCTLSARDGTHAHRHERALVGAWINARSGRSAWAPSMSVLYGMPRRRRVRDGQRAGVQSVLWPELWAWYLGYAAWSRMRLTLRRSMSSSRAIARWLWPASYRARMVCSSVGAADSASGASCARGGECWHGDPRSSPPARVPLSATKPDGTGVHGMEEVWGSNPHSSTLQ
jgi:hypothetical protein